MLSKSTHKDDHGRESSWKNTARETHIKVGRRYKKNVEALNGGLDCNT